jgi:hypothetical protein
MLEPIYINLEPELAEQLEQKRREDLQFQLTKLGHFQESLEIYPKEFPVRWVWCDEAMYFTPWLKKHLKYLQPFICYPIHTVASQVQIVNFWIDLVAYSYNHDWEHPTFYSANRN